MNADWILIPIAKTDEKKVLKENKVAFQLVVQGLYIHKDDIEKAEKALNSIFIIIGTTGYRIQISTADTVINSDRFKTMIKDVASKSARLFSPRNRIVTITSTGLCSRHDNTLINFASIPTQYIAKSEKITLGKTTYPSDKFSFWKKTVIPNNGIMITDVSGNDGVVLARVHHRVINVVFQIGDPTVRSLMVMKRVLKKAISVSINENIFGENLSSNVSRTTPVINEAKTEDYLRLCDSNRKTIITNLKRRSREGQVAADRSLRNYRDYLSQVSNTNLEITALENHEMASDKYKTDFSRISERPDILKVGVSGNELVVITDMLKIKARGYKESVDVGKYKILINVHSRAIRIMNLSKRLNYGGYQWDHPHIPNTRPCWGNIGSTVSKLLIDYDFPGLVGIIINYLQSVNLADAYGSNFKKWKKDYDRRKGNYSFSA